MPPQIAVGDPVRALLGRTTFQKGDRGICQAVEMVDSEEYITVRLKTGWVVGPTLADSWEVVVADPIGRVSATAAEANERRAASDKKFDGDPGPELMSSTLVVMPKAAVPSTPAAKWRVDGQPDPHGTRYDGERASLCLGHFTDDELANAAFMNYDVRPPLQDILDKKAHSPIAYMTAVKERIRWLSRRLEETLALLEIERAKQAVSPEEMKRELESGQCK